MLRIGFVGLGIMGRGMVANLVAAGHRPTVWNRTRSKAEGLTGVEVAATPAELAASSDVVCICVSDTPDVEEVVFAEGGIAAGLGDAAFVVDHSTISPTATTRFSEMLGGRWLDAPISGGSEGAKAGTLSIMVGGPVRLLETAKPIMEAYSKTIVHIGSDPGSGQLAKLVNQILSVVNILSVGEALLFASAAGLDLGATLRAVKAGAAGSWALSNRGPQMIERDWSPGFTIDLQQKDLRLVLETADNLSLPVPATAFVFQMYRSLQGRGFGAEGNHALVKALEALAGVEIGG